MKNKYPFLVILSFILCKTGISQDGTWTRNEPFEQKVFIENKGQFDEKNNLKNSQILFGVNNGGFQIYFTSRGLTYRMDKWGMTEKNFKKLMKEENEEKNVRSNHEENEQLMEPELLQSSVVQLEWLNANPNPMIISIDPVTEYFNYASANPDKNIHHAKAFKKIIYKNLYPNIDLEYVFHKKKGIKYAFILHPGADPGKIKIKYSGADKISIDENGNIQLATSFGDITDHAPVCYYAMTSPDEDKKDMIASSFQIESNIVTFQLENYDDSKTVVIDPWTIDPLFNKNKAWDVESDPVGNVYVFGGGTYSPFIFQVLKKYDAAGNPQWTFTLPYPGHWHGDLAVDNAGNSYVSAVGGTGGIIKIDNTGLQIFKSINVIPAGACELFCMVFNKPKTQLVGTTHPSTQYLVNINTTTGVGMNFSSIVGGGIISEIRSLTSSPNGNFYALSCNNLPALSTVIAVTPLLAPIWTASAGYPAANFDYYGPQYTGFVNCSFCGPPYNTLPNPNGQNGIAASNCFVYTYEGRTLKKWNIASGTLVASVAVPFGVAARNSGIIVDSCDFVYVGTTRNITKYDPSFNVVSTIPTPDSVYCLSFGATMGTILACGNRFVGSFANSANPKANVPFTQTTATTAAGCSCNGTATVTPLICSYATPVISYLWSNGQTTQTINGLCAGTYTVTTTAVTLCGSGTQITTATVGSNPTGLPLSLNVTNDNCNANINVGTATITPLGGTPAYTYNWSNGGTTSQISDLAPGTYSVTVTDSKSCTATSIASIISYSPFLGQFTKGIASCTDCGCKEWIMVTAAGGTSPYTYAWPDGSTNRYKNQLCPGTYTINIKDKNGCSVNVNVAAP